VGSTMHWGPDSGHNKYPLTHWERNTAPGQGFNGDFHNYQVEWTPGKILIFTNYVNSFTGRKIQEYCLNESLIFIKRNIMSHTLS
jgi:hypothetical protein